MRVSQKLKRFFAMGSVIALTIALLIAAIMYKGIEQQVVKRNVNAELAKSKTYAQVADGDEATNSDNVQFDAFFLRDLDLDGNAEKLRGSCRQIGKEDTLYMELNVLGEGYLKDAKITINDGNYYLKTETVKDREVAENVLTEKATEINFNKLNNGTQKLLFGGVRSGYYNSSDRVAEAIGNKQENYSKENTITLTGTHVIEDEEGQIISETQVEKEVRFEVDWYGENKTIFIDQYQTVEYEGDTLLSEEGLVFEAKLNVKEDKGQLINKKACIEGTIPAFNGYNPVSVEIKNKPEDVTFTYDDSTGEFELYKENEINEDGELSSIIGRDFYNTLKIVYPKEAYDNVNADTVEISIPVKAYFESYNNDSMEGIDSITKSNEAETAIEILYTRPRGQETRFSVNVYNSAYYGEKKISKIKPLNIYNGVSDSETNDNYYVEWRVYAGTAGNIQSVILKEADVDKFIKTDSSEVSMDDLTTAVEISFSRVANSLGDEGWIKVYNDDTDELVGVYYKNDWISSIRFAEPVKHVRIETSAISQKTDMAIYLKKTIADDYVVNNYTREEFDSLNYIKSQLKSYVNGEFISNTIGIASYEEPESFYRIDSSLRDFSTQDTKRDVELTIETARPYSNESLWGNSIFLLELPEEIAQIKIKDVTVNNNKVTIDSYEKFEQNNKNYIKIYTSNSEKSLYKISIICDIIPNPKANTNATYINAWAINKENENYYINDVDAFDLDNDGNVIEYVGTTSSRVKFVSPNSLLISQEAHDYSELDEYTIAPRIAEVSKDQRTAKVQLNLNNNYSNTISNVMILGKIPFENNTYVLSNNDAESDYSTTMTNEGIIVPEKFAEKAKVYYSTKENPTKDLSNSANGWTLNPSDFSQVKSYLIDISEYVIERGTDELFTYNIQLPTGIEFEKVSYSVFAVYFALDTVDGKYYTQTEPAKLGFKVVKKYNLELTKYQKNANKKVSGATYLLTQEKESEEDEEIYKTAGTREGIASFSDLYINRIYTIKEILSPDEYELNDDEVKFRTYIENGETKVEVLEGTTKSAEIIKLQGEDYKAAISVEDKVRANIEIVKTNKETDEVIEGVKYRVTGKGFDEGKIITTNSEGKVILSGLYVEEEYTLEETKAKDYYLLDTVKFIIHENNGEYSVEITEGTVKSTDDREEDSIPVMILNVEDDPIPSYDLKIVKKEKGSDTLLSGARFKIEGEGIIGSKFFKTDDNGEAVVNGLYQYIEGKYITGEYTLTEVDAPDGYKKIDEIGFRVVNENNQLKFESDSSLVKNIEINNNIVTMTLEDKPVFKLTKVNENDEPLSGVKFAIYEIDENGNKGDFAKNTKGEYVGTKDNQGRYVVTTDENGEISIPLADGIYTVVETETLNEYELNTEERIIRIEGTTRAETSVTNDIVEINYVEDLLDVSLNVLNGVDDYSGKTIKLMRDLDWDNSSSYRNAEDTSYGDLNGNNIDESIIDELTGTKGIGFIPIGYITKKGENSFDNTRFKGIFDGQDKSITDFYVKIENLSDDYYKKYSYGSWYTSLFGKIEDAEVNNLNLYTKENVFVYKFERQAGIIGDATNSKINNCNFYGNFVFEIEGNTNQAGYDIAGIVGMIINSEVNNCTATGECIAPNNDGCYSGGIVGQSETSSINNCVSRMKFVYESFDAAGGIVGYLNGNSSVNGCINYGELRYINDGTDIIGGIAGYLSGQNEVVENCYNYGNITCRYARAGGIVAVGGTAIRNCHNYGDVKIISDSTPYGKAGGIIGSANNNTLIEYCHNSGEIATIGNGGASNTGGISGYNGRIHCCYNEGTIMSINVADGETASIGVYANEIEDCYNTGDIIVKYNRGKIFATSDFYAIGDSRIVNNCYNTGNIYFIHDGLSENVSNNGIFGYNVYDGNYYLDSVNIPKETEPSGIAISDEMMRSQEYFDILNVNGVWVHEDGEYPKLKMPVNNVLSTEEITVKNKLKQYKITTEIKERDGVKGGSISGEKDKPYEVVGYNGSTTKNIVMQPSAGYEIVSITVNGKDYPFTVESRGASFTMPQFENVVEDKHIVVSYASMENQITINKVDAVTGENIEEDGVQFEIEEIDSRDDISQDVIGELTNSGSTYNIPDYDQEVTDVVGPLTANGEYYFVEEDGKYVPINSKTWQVNNVEGATDGIRASKAYSYVEVDLTDLEGNYDLEVYAESNTCNSWIDGEIYVSKTSSKPGYYDDPWVSLEKDIPNQKYIYTNLKGGNKYYIHLIYNRNVSNLAEEYYDSFSVNSIKVYKNKSEQFNFVNNNGVYESTNEGFNSTESKSYIPIDLTGLHGKYYVIVQASVSSSNGNSTANTDYGSVNLYNVDLSKATSVCRIKGEVEPTYYTAEIDGGYTYKLNLSYYKSKYNSVGEDKFKVYSIEIKNSTSDLYKEVFETNRLGKVVTSLPLGERYKVTELRAPDGYDLAANSMIIDLRDEENIQSEYNFEDERVSRVTTNHKIATRNEDGTYNYTDNEIAESTTQEDAVGRDYTTKPIIDLEKYELITDDNGKEIIPENASGEYTVDEINVNYYYVKKQVPLTVNHYIVGTTTPVPSKTGEAVEPEEDKGEEGEEYTTTKSADASDDYELAEAPKNANGSYAFPKVNVNYFYQPIERNITIRKLSEDGETRLANAKFKIYKDGEEESAEEYITDENGEIKIKLKAGTYHIQEIEAPSGYTKDDEIIDIDISEETEDYKLFEIINNQKRGTVVVHYYIQDNEGNKTTNRVKDENGEEVSDINKTGIIGAMWATRPAENVASKYELAVEPEQTYGDYIDGNIEVNYYYRLKDTKVTVHHYILDRDGNYTEEKVPSNVDGEVIEDVVINGKVDDEYRTEAATNINDNYELISTPRNATGTMTEDEIEVNYYYGLKNAKVIAKYVDMYAEIVEDDDTDEIAAKEEVLGKVGDDYETLEKVIDGYTFIRSTDNTKGTMTEDEIEVTYYYAKNTKVIVRYLEKGTDEVLSPEVEINGYEGKEFETEEETIDNYTLVEVDGPVSGTMTREEKVVTYYYLQNTKARVEYIDKTDNHVIEWREQTGLVGDEFVTEAKEFENYVLVESPEETTISMQKDEVTLRYYYVYANAGLIERHINVLTGAILASEEHGNKTEGTAYKIDPRDIEGYELVTELNGTNYLPDNSEGTYGKDLITVDYYYIRKASVTARYIDKATGEELTEEVVINGLENDPYQTEEKEFNGYVLDSVDGNTNSIMNITTDDEGNVVTNKVVTYYYKKASTIIVNHIDVNTDEILSVERKSGFEGDNYSTTSKKIKSYDLVETRLPENKDGKFARDEQVVNYYYIKKLTVVVEYLDKITGARLAVEDKIEGHEGDTYTTTPKELLGYEVVGVPKNAAGEMKVEEKEDGTFENEIRVTYYYKIPCRVVVEYIDKETGKKLTTSTAIEGYENDEYETKAKEFDGYELIQTPDNAKGIMKVQLNENKETTEIVVRYYYAKKATGVLPQTGEAKTILFIAAIIANVALAFVINKKNKKGKEE